MCVRATEVRLNSQCSDDFGALVCLLCLFLWAVSSMVSSLSLRYCGFRSQLSFVDSDKPVHYLCRSRITRAESGKFDDSFF